MTRNPEIGYTPAWVLPDIWRLGPVRDTKFGTNVSNKMLLNAAKCQGYSLYRFWVVNRWSKDTHLPPRVDHFRAATCKQWSPCRALKWVECAEYNVVLKKIKLTFWKYCTFVRSLWDYFDWRICFFVVALGISCFTKLFLCIN